MKNKQIFRMAKKYCKDPIEKIPGYKEEGLKHSPESRMKIAELNRKRRDKFLEYKASGGSLSFNSWSSTLWHTVKEVA